jgi:hypothetical protein
MKLPLLCLAAALIITPLATAAERDVLTEEFRKVIMRAHTVAVVEVIESTVLGLIEEAVPWSTETVTFKNPVLIYGKAVPKGRVRLNAARYPLEGKAPLAQKPGAKVIVAWATEEYGAALVPHSPAAVLATRRALTPGWSVDSGLLCPKCMQLTFTADIGECKTCGGGTASGGHKLCKKCAPLAGQCQACQRNVDPATPHVSLRLTYINPRTRMMEPKQLMLTPGKMPALWVSVQGDAREIPPVIELPCMINMLGTCRNLFFLVEGPGIKSFEVVGFTAPVPMIAAPYKPLTKANAIGRLTLTLQADGKAFKAPGTYTVRAFAGRLVSNPRTVVVAGKGKIKPDVEARPRPDIDRPIPPFRPQQPIRKR